MTDITPKFITVPDAVTGADVPALITAENEDGSVNVVVFGSSDVIEKRIVAKEEDAETDPEADPATATGKRRAATTESGDA